MSVADADNDYYRVLGLARSADEREVKAAFRRLARCCHPDVNGGDVAAGTVFRHVHEAYETLINPVRRREYDAACKAIGASPNGMAKQSDASHTHTRVAERPLLLSYALSLRRLWHEECAACAYVWYWVRRRSSRIRVVLWALAVMTTLMLGLSARHVFGAHPAGLPHKIIVRDAVRPSAVNAPTTVIHVLGVEARPTESCSTVCGAGAIVAKAAAARGGERRPH